MTPAVLHSRRVVRLNLSYWQLQQYTPCTCPGCEAEAHWLTLAGSPSQGDARTWQQADRQEANSMSYVDRMTPTLRAIRARTPDALTDLNRGNALAILSLSQPLVPVDTGALKGSGRVEKGKGNAAILAYGGGGFTNPRTGRAVDYAVPVHYRKKRVRHKVGQSQFVGQPLRTERPARIKATARAFSQWLRRVR